MRKGSFGKSIKTQLIVLLFGLTAVSIGVVAFLGISAVLDSGKKAEVLTSESMQERAEGLLVQTTTATAEKNSLLFQDAQRTTFMASEYVKGLFEHPDKFPNSYWKFDQNIAPLPAGQLSNKDTEPSSVFLANIIQVTPEIKRRVELTAYMDFYAPQAIKDDPNAIALYYIGNGGESRYYPNIGLASVSEPDFNPTTAEFFTIATPQNDPNRTSQWTAVYDDPAGNGLMITAVHPVYANNAFAGVMGADVTLANIAKNIEDYSPIESSYAFLIDNAGRAIALPAQGYKDILSRAAKKNEFGADLQKVKGGFASVLKDMRAGKSGFQQIEAQNKQLYVSYAPLTGTNFSLAIVAKRDVLLQVVGKLETQVKQSTRQVLYFQILPIAGLLLVLVWIAGYLYIRFITNPVIALTNKANHIAQGSFTEEIDFKKVPDNEVGELTNAFNKMTRELAGSYEVLQRKLAEIASAKAKDEAILNSIGDGLIVTDNSGHILLMNKIAAELMGADRNSVLGQKIDQYPLLNDKGSPLAIDRQPMMIALKTGQKINQDVTVVINDGKTKNSLNVTATPVMQESKIIGAIQTIRDITKTKEIDRMKTEFISIASHQLRTPLSAIKWFGEMLLQGDAGKLQEEQTEFVKNISASTDRMIELVNALLNISRLESGRIVIEPTPTDLKALITGIIQNDLKAKIERHELQVTFHVDDAIPKVNLDAQLISQVYLNLLTNAINYTPKGGTVTLNITMKDGYIISQVADSGYGIPVEEQGKLFKKFFRGSNVMQVETDGTGLGMYLVKAIVDSSGGKIWFKSEENKGSTFWFSLPVTGMKAKEGEVKLDERSYG